MRDQLDHVHSLALKPTAATPDDIGSSPSAVIGQSAGVISLAIRDAVPDDVPFLRDLFRRSSLSNEGDRVSLLGHPDALEFPGVAIDEQRTRVATDGRGRIVGFSTVAASTGFLELEDLFVDPDRMRQGIGRRLVLDIVERARPAGVARLEVTANHHALAFYEDAGFVFHHDVETRFGPAPRMHLQVTP
jgi:GNAT superfamily N-acetyltransferase